MRAPLLGSRTLPCCNRAMRSRETTKPQTATSCTTTCSKSQQSPAASHNSLLLQVTTSSKQRRPASHNSLLLQVTIVCCCKSQNSPAASHDNLLLPVTTVSCRFSTGPVGPYPIESQHRASVPNRPVSRATTTFVFITQARLESYNSFRLSPRSLKPRPALSSRTPSSCRPSLAPV